jgi:hypothetical protein
MQLLYGYIATCSSSPFDGHFGYRISESAEHLPQIPIAESYLPRASDGFNALSRGFAARLPIVHLTTVHECIGMATMSI